MAFLLLGVTVFAEKNPKAPLGAKVKVEEVEKTGVIEIQKADQTKKEKYDTVLLKVAEETFRLIPGKDKAEFKKLEAMPGKQVTVKGGLLPANPPKYPLAAIKVDSYSTPPESTEKPAQ
jgi:hypothetical protein